MPQAQARAYSQLPTHCTAPWDATCSSSLSLCFPDGDGFKPCFSFHPSKAVSPLLQVPVGCLDPLHSLSHSSGVGELEAAGDGHNAGGLSPLLTFAVGCVYGQAVINLCLGRTVPKIAPIVTSELLGSSDKAAGGAAGGQSKPFIANSWAFSALLLMVWLWKGHVHRGQRDRGMPPEQRTGCHPLG